MIIPLTLVFGALGYLYYKSKDEISLIETDQVQKPKDKLEEDELYKDLEDLFI